jgi:hypothetical protein
VSGLSLGDTVCCDDAELSLQAFSVVRPPHLALSPPDHLLHGPCLYEADAMVKVLQPSQCIVSVRLHQYKTNAAVCVDHVLRVLGMDVHFGLLLSSVWPATLGNCSSAFSALRKKLHRARFISSSVPAFIHPDLQSSNPPPPSPPPVATSCILLFLDPPK